MGVNKLIEVGKDIESAVLSKAIKLHCKEKRRREEKGK